jgi:2-oxoisovalerate dehydrogenase E1 component
MPSHWGHKDLNIVSEASTTGTQYLSAVGCAEAGLFWQRPDAPKGRPFHHDEVVYCSSGEGATSQGVFFEALNSACMDKLPVIFHIEDNGWAISTPVEKQTAGGSISALLAGYPNLLRLEFDGCCPEACHAAWAEGVAYARARKGPVLMHAHVVRPYSHSLSDDEKLYRSQDDLAEQMAKDPLPRFRDVLLKDLKKGAERLMELEAEVEAQLTLAKDNALVAQPPDGLSATRYVFCEDVDPASEVFDSPPKRLGDDKTMVDLINTCLRDEMHKDGSIVVFGEDVADVSREQHLDVVRGKGGVFKVTHGLQRQFGAHRVFNTPLAEANIIGRAFGMALRGLKPVVEIQFFDYIWPAMMQLRSEVALLRWRSNNAFSCPMVIRAAYGGYLTGGSIFHSQTGESIFTHLPGLRVVLPSCAEDAHGLLRTAIRCNDPVLFLEHKHLYRQTYNRAPYPGPDHAIPFGRARVVHAGEHITLVTYGALVRRSLEAQRILAQDGIRLDIIDLRTLAPYDWPTIAASIKRTSRALVVHEESRSFGFGAEIAARIADELFDCLDAPVRRVAALDTFVGYHPNLEDHILPQVADIVAAARALRAY